MKVIVRYAQVVSITNVPTLPLTHPEEKIIEAPDWVKVGWYHVEDMWIPPESQRNDCQDERSRR